MSSNKRAVVLLSGGLDSTTTAAIAKSEGFDVYGLTFDYGQRHDVEIKAAQQTAERLGLVDHKVCQIDLRVFGGSALTSDIEVPKGRSTTEMNSEIPVTYVPARNTIFLSFALAWSEVLKANDIFIGVNALDYSGYPDCRPEFIEAFQELAKVATKVGVNSTQKLTIHTPLIQLTKAQIIRCGLNLGVDYSQTITCYDPTDHGIACGRCDACFLRLKGFEENSIPDPAPYQKDAMVPA